MFRYSMFLVIVLGTAATAFAAMSPQLAAQLTAPSNTTVIFKNPNGLDVLAMSFASCKTEDCSDTPQN